MKYAKHKIIICYDVKLALLNGRWLRLSFWASRRSVALAGGEAARIVFETSIVSSFKGESSANSLYLPEIYMKTLIN